MVFLEAYIKNAKPTKENFDFIYNRFMEIRENNWNYKRTAIAFRSSNISMNTYWTALSGESDRGRRDEENNFKSSVMRK